MRLILGAVLLLSLAFETMAAELGQAKKQIPPVESQATPASETKPESKDTLARAAQSVAPLTVNVTGALEVHSEEAQNGAGTESSKWIDPITLFTALLVLVGGAQVWVLIRQAKIMRDQATILTSTDKTQMGALKIAEQQIALFGHQTDIIEKQHAVGRLAYIATHRPRVIVRFVQGPFIEEREGETFYSAFVTVVNVGVTEATVVAVGTDLAWRHATTHLWEPPGIDASAKDINAVILKSGERWTIPVGPKVFSVGEAINQFTAGFNESGARPFDMCVIGEVRYTDITGTTRHTGFLRVHDPARDCFVTTDEPEEYAD